MAEEEYQLKALRELYPEVKKNLDVNPEIRGLMDLIGCIPPQANMLARKLTRFAYYDLGVRDSSKLAVAIHKEISDRAVGYRRNVESVAREYGLLLGDSSLHDWNKAMNATADTICCHKDNPFEVPEKIGPFPHRSRQKP